MKPILISAIILTTLIFSVWLTVLFTRPPERPEKVKPHQCTFVLDSVPELAPPKEEIKGVNIAFHYVTENGKVNSQKYIDLSVSNLEKYFGFEVNLSIGDTIISETKLHESLQSFDVQQELTAGHQIGDAVNVFVIESIFLDGFIYNGYVQPFLVSDLVNNYPNYFDNVFISYEALANGKTLSHEIGHYLGLNHTTGCCELMSAAFSDCGIYLNDSEKEKALGFLVEYRNKVVTR